MRKIVLCCIEVDAHGKQGIHHPLSRSPHFTHSAFTFVLHLFPDSSLSSLCFFLYFFLIYIIFFKNLVPKHLLDLSLYHTIRSLHDPERVALLVKEKTLITSILSFFFHNVFCPIKDKFWHVRHIQLSSANASN